MEIWNKVNGAHILDVGDICTGVGFRDASASKKCESWQLTGETRNWRSVSWNWNFLSCCSCCSCQTWLYQSLGFLFWDKPDFDCSCFIIMILSQTSPLPVGEQGPRRGQKRARVSCWSSSWPHWPTGLLTEDWCCPVQVPSLDSANRFVTCGSNNWYNAEHGKGMQASLRLVAQIAEPIFQLRP